MENTKSCQFCKYSKYLYVKSSDKESFQCKNPESSFYRYTRYKENSCNKFEVKEDY